MTHTLHFQYNRLGLGISVFSAVDITAHQLSKFLDIRFVRKHTAS